MTVNPIVIRKPAGRSMGLKLLLVFGLTLLMSIPALFVFSILMDRTHRAQRVTQEVGNLVGGPQNFAGPVLVIPYIVPATPPEDPKAARPAPTYGDYVVFPVTAAATASSKSSVRQRGLFKTSVWAADVAMKSSFDLTGIETRVPPRAIMAWDRAELLTGVNDARGARGDIVLNLAGKQALMTLTPLAASLSTPRNPNDGTPYTQGPSGLQMFGASAQGLAQPGARFDAAVTLKFAGAESLAMLAYGRTTHFTINGDWPDPSYSGTFARDGDNGDEVQAKGTAQGYKASWSVPFVARGVPAEGQASLLNALSGTAMRVSFVDTANPYQAVSRSLTYAPLFLGLVFLLALLLVWVKGRVAVPV